VKLRSDQVRANRIRLGVIVFLSLAGPFFGLYLLWRTGEVILNRFVYENPDFAVQNVEVQTSGVIAPEQLRRWSGVKPGANLISLDLATVKRNLELVSAVDTVSVERVLPRTLKIRVTERDPIAQVNITQADANGGIGVGVYQLSANGVVMRPLDPRFCSVPVAQANEQLPLITGLNVFQLQMGKRVELTQVQAALQLITSFEHSPMAGLVDLYRLDVSAPGVVVVTTRQGSELTFALDGLDQQLRRWRSLYDMGLQRKATIAWADLAVENNVPVRWAVTGAAPDATAKPAKPVKNRRRNV
jgi:cell division protein FtsQ